MQIEKYRFEQDCLAKIGEDRIEVDRLIRELDQLKQENISVEQEQMRLLESVSKVEVEVGTASDQLGRLR